MILPLGLDSARLSRFPAVSAAIVGTCIAVFVLGAVAGGEEEADRATAQAVAYLRQHPYLAPPQAMAERLGIDPARPAAARPAPGLTRADVAVEQAELELLARRMVEAEDAALTRRLSFVKARGALQLGWITHLFVHGGLLHLAGNLLIFVLITGPFLEDAWGRPFFAGFYLLGGAVAAAFELPSLPPHVPLLGASGAISACLGAFAIRFAHRRVRMLWLWLGFPFFFVRREFRVPAWLYAFLGFGADLVGLQLAGGSGIAYGAHVGGFLFGVGAALLVRWSGLERRLAPDGAVQWRGGGMDHNRAAEALAEGDVFGARARLEDVLRRRPDDAEAALDLARIHAGQLDLGAATALVERVVSRRLAANDLAGVRAIAAEFQGRLRADRLRPATAYRLAEAIDRDDPGFALALLEAAGAAGGGVGAKALARAAERVAAAEPERARALLAKAEAMAADPAVRARIEAQRAALPPPPDLGLLDPVVTSSPLPAGAAVREVWCRVARIDGGTLDLVASDGRLARLTPDRVAFVATALLDRLSAPGAERKNGVVLDLVLRPRGAGPRVLLRIPGHEMQLGQHRPDVPSGVAFAELIEAILLLGGAAPWPDRARAQGRPFVRFPDLAGYEHACFGRRVAG